jgi:hypothetical protein
MKKLASFTRTCPLHRHPKRTARRPHPANAKLEVVDLQNGTGAKLTPSAPTLEAKSLSHLKNRITFSI